MGIAYVRTFGFLRIVADPKASSITSRSDDHPTYVEFVPLSAPGCVTTEFARVHLLGRVSAGSNAPMRSRFHTRAPRIRATQRERREIPFASVGNRIPVYESAVYVRLRDAGAWKKLVGVHRCYTSIWSRPGRAKSGC